MKKIIEGSISVKSVLENGRRQCNVLHVNKKKRSKDFAYIIALAKKAGVKVNLCLPEEIEKVAKGTTHGGIVLEVEDRAHAYLDQRLDGFICYIDGLEDPYNLGSVCRSLYASGCNALILPERDWGQSESVILKASAGAYEKMDIYYSRSDVEFVEFMKKYNIPLFCAYRNNALSIYEIKYPDTCCIAIGGALRGLSSKILQNADENIVIEYPREFRNALDTPSAAAVIAFEIARQKRSIK